MQAYAGSSGTLTFPPKAAERQATSSVRVGDDLIEDAVFLEVFFLCFAPAAEEFVDGEEGELRECRGVVGCDFLVARAVEVFGDDFLCFGGVEELEVGLGDFAGAALVNDFVHDGDRRFGEDADGRRDDLVLVGAELLKDEMGFVFPREEDVSEFALDEGVGGAAGAGVEDGDVLIELGDELAGFGLIELVGLQRVAPRSEVVPARAAGSLGVWRDNFNAFADDVRPVLDVFGIALADDEDDGGGVGGRVLGELRAPVGGDQVAVGVQGLNVRRKGEGDDVGFKSVDHGTSLLARAAVGLIDLDGLVVLCLPLGGKEGVDGGVEFACGVVRDVEEGDLLGGLCVRAPGWRGDGGEEEDGG